MTRAGLTTVRSGLIIAVFAADQRMVAWAIVRDCDPVHRRAAGDELHEIAEAWVASPGSRPRVLDERLGVRVRRLPGRTIELDPALYPAGMFEAA